MDKCVKCGRCVEVCQNVQTIQAINSARRSHEYEISTPYKRNLSEGPCVFCGRCAAVCPVGAIYEHDQTARVWDSLNDSGKHTIAQVSPVFADAVNKEFGFPVGAITIGKIITAIKRLGFDDVFDAGIAAKVSDIEHNVELQHRIKTGGKLPIITGCSVGVVNFIKYFYPDLAGHLAANMNPRQIFADSIKADYAQSADIDYSDIMSVSFTTDIAQKYLAGAQDETDFALTAAELARMIKLAGIDIKTLPESPFDSIDINLPKQDNLAEPAKRETVFGYAEARKVLEAIRKGECYVQWIEIVN
jgi:iron only hydrogenase large subunit-like protein